MITVICYPRLNIRMKHGLSHLGLMHLISTNSIIWMRTIVKESIFEYHEINEENGESNSDWLEMKPLDLEPWNVAHMSSHQTTYPTNISHHSEKTSAIDTLDPDQETFGCYESSVVMANNIIYKVLKESTPVLFPFIIEFSLIGCTMFFSMWKHVGFKQDSLDIYSLNIKRYIQNIDWSNSLRGFLLGLCVLALNIINLSLFFTLQDARDNTDEYIAKLINTFINLVGIGGCIVASYKIQKLKDKKIDDGFDSVLLSLSGFFLIVYSLLEITVGVYGFQSKSTTMVRHSIQVFNGVLSTLATLVQIVFINLTLTKGTVLERNGSDSTNDLDSVDVSARPGRNETLFLAILNFSQWLVFTFEMQKSQSSKTESEYFGRYAWVIIQRVTLPLCIFFRFHSTILLIDAWKNNYKTESKGEFH
ncbi:uncharacterized protein LOC111698436 isoform X2 [Eurytemora carolleeae]|nr:uncharacterized protein LOC111698436 isoform X2 [Eurytemora carolleeae]XP_023324549.1 uncharacterized protein LOC111698436 isoform X2 [Eurytemora carolleeae]|eukprot:XP_023324548.1 uncharacterized protein LOC111698436 isoform X2 [Eurytemora affinis]